MTKGAVRDCGDDEYPGIYVRLDHPSVWNFIASITTNLPVPTKTGTHSNLIMIGTIQCLCHKLSILL